MADNKVSVPELNGPGSQAPELNAIVGCAGAGKTTVRVAFRLDDPRWPHHLNFDEYRHALKDQFNDPVFAATKLCALPAAVFDSLNWSTRSLIMSMADSYMARRQSFSMETTGDDGLFPIIRKARFAGYRVHGAIVLTKDPYINIARIRKPSLTRATLMKRRFWPTTAISWPPSTRLWRCLPPALSWIIPAFLPESFSARRKTASFIPMTCR